MASRIVSLQETGLNSNYTGVFHYKDEDDVTSAQGIQYLMFLVNALQVC
ncbi:hypothetical protein KC19_1G244700 [Ceratodon purpureus]|uniref:Uncharacterized protein n=1 Tax=Ceratodon purpureus TaxID=3225 RepID=A0A8T0JB89_CERPU|nr:hypothetical protein KC19_1G244700 [Ceratodon purpureus]